MDDAGEAGPDYSGNLVPEDLRRPGLLGRFPPQTESAYQVWFTDQATPLLRIVTVPSILIWIPLPFLFEFWVGRPPTTGVYVESWAIAIPVLGLLLAATYSKRRNIQVPVAAAAVIIVGALSFHAFYNFLSVPLEAGILGVTIWLNSLIPFVRTPFRTAVALCVLISALGGGYLVAAANEAGTSREFTWPYFMFIFVVAVTVPLMSLHGEQAMRNRYVDEQVIERQRAEIAASRELIRRYAPSAVVDRLEHGDDTVGVAQRQRVTIFFADVVGFTTMADRLDPEALAEIMNDYLGGVADIVERHGGTLNEFAGDGVMALFGAPDEMDPVTQVLAAVAAARELQADLPERSSRWYKLGIDRDLQARIGVNTGVVSVGTFGSAVRATYTGIGLQTNIAARIQAQCPPGSVLLSKTSWSLVQDQVPCEPRGEVEVKGVHFPIAMFEPRMI